MNLLKYHIIVLLWSFYVLKIKTARTGRLDITNVVCENFDESFMTISKCVVNRSKGKRITVSFYAKLHQRIENMTVLAKLLHLVGKKYQPFLYEDEIDFCGFLGSVKHHVLWGLIYDSVSKVSNINHTCPYEDALIVNNLKLEDSQLKLLPLPRGKYQLDFLMSVGISHKFRCVVFIDRS